MNKIVKPARQPKASDTGEALRSELLALEERVMFDAAAAVEVADTAADILLTDITDGQDKHSDAGSLSTALGESPQTLRNEVYFIDGAVNDPAELIAAIPAGAEIVMLDGSQDGVEQIASVLEGRDSVEAIHIFAHGEEGLLFLGTATLDTTTIDGVYSESLSTIGQSLSTDGDILIYGCKFAGNEVGLHAAERLATATGADIAASDDLTGHADFGGDWELETKLGAIEVEEIEAVVWGGVLVDTDGDGVDDTVDIDGDNDGILDAAEKTITFTPLSDTATYSFAQDINGNLARHYPGAAELGAGGDDDPLNIVDGDINTELRLHDGDVFEYDLGQVVPAGTTVTLIEGPGGEDTPVAIYVSLESTDPNRDTLAALGTGEGTGYVNTITNSTLIIAPTTNLAPGASYGTTPSDASVTFVMPHDARFVQLIGDPGGEKHGGWAEIEFTTLTQTIEDLDSDGDGRPDHLDLDKDNDGITDNVEAQTTAGYVAPSGQGTAMVDLNGDGLDDNYAGGLTEVDTDGDGTVDTLDSDSDDDGVLDVAERGDGGPTATPTAPFSDADNDGLLDVFEGGENGDGYDVNDANIAGDDGGADGDYTNFTLADSDLDTNANEAVPGRTSNDAVAGTSDLDYRDNDPDTDLDGLQDSVDIDDDNDGILDVVEQTVTYVSLATSATVTTNEKFDGSSGDSNDLAFLIDGNSATEPEIRNGTVVEYDLGQTVLAGTQITFTEGTSGFDGTYEIYVSNGTQGPNVYANAVTGGGATLVASGTADVDLTITAPIEFTHLQIVVLTDKVGWVEMEFTSLSQVIETRDSDGDGRPDHLDLDKDNDGITDNVEAQTTAGYVAPSGQGTAMVDLNGDGLDDNYAGGLTEVDTDGDGTVDTLDSDSDDDGVLDVAERGDGGPTATPTAPFSDADNDGLLDVFEGGENGDGYDVNDANIAGDDGGADGDYTNFTLADSDLDTNANEAVPGRTSNDAVAGTSDLDYRDNDPDTDLDGLQDSVDIDDDNDGILDVVEQTVTYVSLATSATVTTNEKFDGSSGDSNDLAFLIDGNSATEPEIRNGTVVEYDLGQTVLAGTQITFTEGTSGFDGTYEIYVSNGTQGPNVYANAVTGGGATLVASGTADVDLTITAPIEFTHLQIVVLTDKVGWVEMEFTSLSQVIETRDSDGDGRPDHLDLDKDNDGITDNVEAQTTAGYVAPSGQGTAMVDLNGDGLDDNYAGGLTEVDTDGDGTVDTLDSDSDDDGVLDVAERGDGGPTATPTAPFSDADNDGLLDVFEGGENGDGYDVNDANIAGDDGGADGDYTNFTLADSDLDTNANEAVPGRTSNDAVAGTSDLDYRDTDVDTDLDGLQDSVDIDDDNDGILDVVEQTVTYSPLTVSMSYSYAQNTTGGLATHYGDQGTGGGDDPELIFDDDGTTELRMHVDDIIEYGFGQMVLAGTSITLAEDASGGEDEPIAIYVSFGTTDPDGDAAAISENGVGYQNAVTYGQSVLVYSGPSDANITFIVPTDATHIQFVGLGSHGGWAEIEFTTLTQTIEDLDSDGDGRPDHLDLDKDNDGITDNVEAQTTAGYVAPSGQGTAMVDLNGDGLDDNYAGGLTEVDTDGDGTVDTLDSDSDDDGVLDVAERGDGGPTATPTAPFSDADNDGLLDVFEGGENGDGYDVNDANIAGDDGGADGDYTNFTLADSDLDTNANEAVPGRTSNDAVAGTSDLDYRDNDPDTDLDGLQDSVDIDDDNDGILDVVEQTVTYVSLATSATVTTNEKFDGSSGDSNDLAFLIDGNSATEPEIRNGTVVEYDLGQTVLAGTQITFTEGTSGFDGTYEIYVSNGTQGPNVYANAVTGGGATLVASGTADVDLTITAPIEFTHLQIVVLTDKVGWVEMEFTSLSQVIETRDSDGDGRPDHLDLDKDNDGITDNVEAQTTAGYVAPSGQGTAMVDLNGDGLDDNYAGGLTEVDTDGDGTVDTLDSDSDDDGVLDVAERGDGGPTATPTAPFSDADNDGLLDVFEGGENGDGYDVNDANIAGDDGGADGDYTNFTLADSDLDTNANEAVPGRTSNDAVAGTSDLDYRDNDPDTDLDGLQDSVDIDDDNDGILDVVEQTVTYVSLATSATVTTNEKFDGSSGDSNDLAFLIDGNSATEPEIRNGTVVEYDLGQTVLAGTQITFTEGTSGFDGTYEIYVSNGTQGPNVYANAVTGGGATLVASGTADVDLTITAPIEFTHLQIVVLTDKVGWVEMEFTSLSQVIETRDSDGDGRPDHLDLDKDNDGITDNVEAQTTAGYVAPSGQGTAMVDLNGDGLDDNYAGGLTEVDTDGDGTVDTLDSDSDDDGVLDVAERGDGGPTATPTAPFSDADNDGLLDVFEGGENGDGYDVNDANIAGDDGGADGDYTNFTLADSDLDTNANEAVPGRTSNDAVAGTSDLDYRDNDPDTDLDGLQDSVDIDDDNDGILDVVEQTVTYVSLATSATVTTNEKFDGSSGDSNDLAFLIDGNSATEPEIRNGTVVEYDLGQTVLAGTQITFTEGTSGFDGTYEIYVSNGTQGPNVYANAVTGGGATLVASGTADVDLTITAPIEFTHLQIVVLTDKVGWVEMEFTSLSQVIETRDSDGDGRPDHLDLDKDNDGITDNVEAQTTAGYVAPSGQGTAMVDLNGDGLDDNYAGGLTEVDTDGDGTVDTLDSDSDDDGVLDVAERGDGGPTATPTAPFSDADNDGLLDVFEGGENGDGYDVNDANIAGDDGGADGDYTNFTLADSDRDTNANVPSSERTSNNAIPLDSDLDYRDERADVIVNTPPVADDESFSTSEDTTSGAIDLLIGDTDFDGDALSIQSIAGTPLTPGTAQTLEVTNGTVNVSSLGVVTFKPAANYNGPVNFDYVVVDGFGGSDTGTVFGTVDPVNDDFTDDNETVSVDEDAGPLTGNVIDGISVDGPITVTTFQVAGDATVYSADGTGNGDTATISGVGSLQIQDDGSYSFTPEPDYNGPVPVATYTLTDGSGTDDTSTLTITVDPVNDDFTDDNETVSVDEDAGPLTGNVIDGISVDGPITVTTFQVAGDATVYSADGTGNGDTATISGVGSLQIQDDGSYSFTPEPDYNGPVPVATYTLTDGSGTDDTSTLTITVDPVNDDFTDDNETVSVDEDAGPLTGNVIDGISVDGPITVTTFQVAGDATVYSADGTGNGDTATISGVGSLQIQDDGSYSFTPEPDYNGPVPVATYTLTDGSGTDDTSTLTITVDPVNDDFTDDNETVSVDEDAGPLTGNVIDGISVDGPITVTTFQVAGDATVYSADGTGNGDTATISGVGSLQIQDDGSYSFTPEPDYNGPVPVATYTLTDGSGTDDTSTLTITVDPVNDDFTDDNETVSVDEDAGPLTGNVIDGISVDGPITVTTFQVAGDATVYSADGTGNGDTATISGVGSLQIQDDGSYSFTPEPDYNGPVPVATYTLTDGSGTDDTSTLTITVDPVNDDFTDDNETVSVDEDAGPLTGNVIDGISVDGPITVTTFQVAGDATVYSADGTGNGDTATISGVGSLQIQDDGSYSFTPEPDYNGPVPVATYTLTDGSGTDDTSTLTITVDPVNDDFTDDNETVSVDEDAGPLTGNVIDGISVDGPITVTTFQVAGDATVYSADGTGNGDTATISGVGSLQIQDDGSYSFTPEPDYNGPVPVATYTLTDGSGTDDTSTLTITVDPVNDDFTDDNETVSVDEDAGPLTGNVIDGISVDGPITVTTFQVAGDATVYSADGTGNGDTATISGVGSLQIQDDGSYSFTPEPDYNGPVPVATYTLTDGSGTDDTSTLTITVDPVNDDFTDDNETVSVDEDAGPLTGNVIDGISVDGPITVTTFQVAGDATVYSADGTGNGDTATISGVGSLQIQDDGSYSFTPEPDYNGPVPVATYTLTDGSGTDDTSTLTITVDPVNDDFTDDNETVSVDEDAGPLTGNVIDGISVDGPITVTTFQVAGDATVYSADGTGNGDTATISGVGSLQIQDDGSYSFTPEPDYNGPVPVATYTLTDGSGTDDTSTLTITVDPVNDDFTDDNETVSVDEDAGPLTGNVIDGISVDGPITVTTFQVAGDATVYSADGTGNGDTATISGVGSLQIQDDGSYSFTPEPDYNGPVPVATYTLTDGSGTDDTSTLTITVDPVNDDFTDDNETVSVDEDAGPLTGNVIDGISVDGPITVTTFQVAGDATVYSADGTGNGDTATISGVGSLQIQDDGSYSFTPEPDYNGPVPVATYTLTDGSGTDDTSTLTITVDPVNDDFTDDNETVSVDEDAGPLTGNVIDGISVDGPITVTTFQVAGDATVYSADGTGNGDTATISGVGSLQIQDDGSYSFTPEPDYNGPVPVATYTLTDGSGTDDTSTLTITVDPVNDDFTDDNETVSVDEDAGPLTGNVIDGISVDGPITVTTFQVAGDATVYSADGTGNGDTATISGVGSLQIQDDGSYSFTPEPDYNGPVPVATYTLTDGSGTDDTSTLTITVDPVNDDFTDDNETVSVDEDAGPLTGNVIDGISVDGPITVTTFQVAGDATVYSADGTGNGDTATISGVGSLQIQDDGSYSFTPEPDYNGPVPVATYTLTDGSGTDDTSTLTITVDPVNDDFTDDNETVSVDEDAGPLTGNVIDGISVDGPITVTTFQVAGDATVYSADGTGNGDTATISGVGSLQIQDDGSYSFTPEPDYNGPVPVATYTLTDGSGTDDTSTLTITVDPVNDDFTDDNETVSVDEDAGPLTGNVIDGISVDGPITVTTFQVAGDATVYSADGTGNGDTATISGVGSLQIQDDGSYSFTPEPDYNGPVPVATYTLTDGSGTDDTSTLTITVDPVNDDFTDDNETVSVDEDAGPLTGNVIDGISVDGPITVTTFQVAGDATVYSADGTGNGDTATISGVGSLQIQDDGSYSFTPEPDYNGPVPVATYTLTDGSGTDDTSTLTITVDPVNDDFTDDNETVSVDEDAGPLTGNVIDGISVDGPITVTTFQVAGDATVYSADGTGNGDTATISGVGSLQIQDDGSYSFTPEPDYNGPVPVATYTLTDGSGTDDTSTLTITVDPVNDDFTDDNETVSVDEDAGPLTGNVIDGISVDGPITVTTFQVAGDATVYSADGTGNGDTATISGVGSLQIQDDGSYSFTPEPDYNGPVPVATYTLTDGSGTDDTSTLTITVDPVNDVPVVDIPVADQSAQDGETVSITGDFSDIDGDTLTYSVSGLPAGLSLNTTTGQISGTLDNSASQADSGSGPGLYTITITASDSSLTVDDSFTYTVTNPAPTADDEINATAEDTTLTAGAGADNLLTGDVDPDADTLTITTFTVAGDLATYTAGDTATLTEGDLTINADGSYSFVPALNFNGAVPVATYTVDDGEGGTDEGTLTLSISPVNDLPVGVDDVLPVTEDVPVLANVLGNDTDADGDSLTISAAEIDTDGNGTAEALALGVPTALTDVTGAQIGTITVASDGTVSFDPAPNYIGPVPDLVYTPTDGTADGSAATVTIGPVVPADDPLAITGLTDGAVPGTDGSVLESDLADGTTAAGLGETLTGSFTISVADGVDTLDVGGTAISEAALVAATPGAPVSVTTPLGTLAITDFDATTGVISYTYTLSDAADHSGGAVSEDIALILTDDDGDTVAGTLSVAVIDDAPVANADTDEAVNTAGNPSSEATGNVVTGSAPGGDPNTLDGVADAVGADEVASPVTGVVAGTGTPLAGNVGVTVTGSYGTLTLNGDGSYRYVPDYADPTVAALTPGVSVADVFSYEITDADGDTATATLSVTIVGTPAVLGLGDGAVPGSDGTALESDLADGTNAGGGGDVLLGSFTVAAPKGIDTLEVGGTVIDEATLLATGTTPVTLTTVLGTLEVDGYDAATGTVNYTYTLADDVDHSGGAVTDDFTVTLTDVDGDASSGTLSIAIGNDAPVAVADAVSLGEDEAAPVTGNVVTGSDTVGADDTASPVTGVVAGTGTPLGGVGSAVAGSYGTLTLNTDGSYSYALDTVDPAVQGLQSGESLTDVFTYEITDGDGDTATAALTLTIAGANDAPVAAADTASTPEDTPVAGNVLTNDSDPDGDPLIVTAASVDVDGNGFDDPLTLGAATPLTNAFGDPIGTLTLGSDGAYSFVPALDYDGLVPQISYTVSDGEGGAAVATLDITLTPVNDLPVGVTDTLPVTEDTPASANVLGNDTDADGDSLTISAAAIDTNGDGTPEALTLGSPTSITDATGSSIGTITVASDGTVSFDPAPNYIGPVPDLVYTPNDGTADGSPATVTVGPISPVNDLPVGVDDVLPVTEDVPVLANVLGNDTDADGDSLTISAAEIDTDGNGTAEALALGVPTALTDVTGAQIGTITVASDGTVSFDPAPNYIGPVPDLVYTPTDGTADGSAATVTIGPVVPADDPLAITGLTDGAVPGTDGSVLESDLADGTTAAGLGETLTGSFTISVADGVDTLDVGGTAISEAALVAATPGAPVSVTTPLGTLAITDFDATTGVISYTYTLSDAADHSGGAVSEDIALILTDDDGDTVAGTLSVAVIDDAPVANADTDEAVNTAGNPSSEATGNVVTGSAPGGDPNTLDGVADAVGADEVASPVTGVVAGTGTPLAGNVGVTVTGSYGTLTLNGDGSYRYVPDYADPTVAALTPGVSVADVFSYEITDADGDTATATLSVTIVGTPAVLGLGDGAVPGSDGTALESDLADGTNAGGGGDVLLGSFTVAAPKGIDTLEVGGTVIDEATLLATGTTPVTLTTVLGTLEVDGYDAATGTVNYTYTLADDVDHSGGAVTDDFTVTLTDVDGDASSGTLSIAIGNDAPVAVADAVSLGEDEAAPVTGNVVTGSDTVGADDTASPVTGVVAGTGTPLGGVGSAVAGSYGTLTLNTDGSYSYALDTVDPAVQGLQSGESLTDVFTYEITDGDGDTATAALTLTIAGANDAPVAAADTASTPEDTPVAGNVLTNDSDPDGDPLIVTAASVDVDGNGFDDPLTLGAATPLTNAFGDPIGTLTLGSDGAYSFVPALDYDGLVPQISYTVSDGEGGAAVATLDITLTPVNDLPVGVTDTLPVTEDTPASANVLGNDTDADGDSLTISAAAIDTNGDGTPEALTLGSPTSITDATGSSIGTITVASDGTVSFDPAPNYIGPVPDLVYTPNDGTADGSPATVTVGPISPVNDLPVGNPDTVTTEQRTPVSGNLLLNDTDVDGDPLTISLAEVDADGDGDQDPLPIGTPTLISDGSGAPIGVLALASDGTFTFNPEPGFIGLVPPVTYTILDGNGGSASSTLSISVITVDPSFPADGSPFVAPDRDALQRPKLIVDHIVAETTNALNDLFGTPALLSETNTSLGVPHPILAAINALQSLDGSAELSTSSQDVFAGIATDGPVTEAVRSIGLDPIHEQYRIFNRDFPDGLNLDQSQAAVSQGNDGMMSSVLVPTRTGTVAMFTLYETETGSVIGMVLSAKAGETLEITSAKLTGSETGQVALSQNPAAARITAVEASLKLHLEVGLSSGVRLAFALEIGTFETGDIWATELVANTFSAGAEQFAYAGEIETERLKQAMKWGAK